MNGLDLKMIIKGRIKKDKKIALQRMIMPCAPKFEEVENLCNI